MLDTNVLAAALRSASGASNHLLRRSVDGDIVVLASVPLFIGYEAVLTRPEQRAATRLGEMTTYDFLDRSAGTVEPVEMHRLRRPQSIDVADEVVLETAINGRADCIVTFNERHFAPALRFAIEVAPPAEAVRRIR